jgi:hypothetical protein
MSMVMAVLSLSMLTFHADSAIENWGRQESQSAAVIQRVGDSFERTWRATTEFFQTLQGMYQLRRDLAGTTPERPVSEAPAAGAAQNAEPAPQESAPSTQEPGR